MTPEEAKKLILIMATWAYNKASQAYQQACETPVEPGETQITFQLAVDLENDPILQLVQEHPELQEGLLELLLSALEHFGFKVQALSPELLFGEQEQETTQETTQPDWWKRTYRISTN